MRKIGNLPNYRDIFSSTALWRLSVTAVLTIAFLIVIIVSPVKDASAVTPQDDWTSLETPHFVIHVTKRANVEEIGRTAEAIYTWMATRYNYSQTQKIDLYIYTDRSVFLAGSPSPNAAGYAQPSKNLVAILQGAGNSTVTLTHEINHIIFMNSVPRINTVPQWFIEGLAIHESQPGIEAARLEKYALAKDVHDLVGPLSSTWPEPADPQDYAQGYMKVKFIVDKFGEARLRETIESLQAGTDFDRALIQTLGFGQDELNAEWKSYARNQIIMIWLMQLRDVGWYLMAALVVVAVIVAPIIKKKRLSEMEDEGVVE